MGGSTEPRNLILVLVAPPRFGRRRWRRTRPRPAWAGEPVLNLRPKLPDGVRLSFAQGLPVRFGENEGQCPCGVRLGIHDACIIKNAPAICRA
jgi:hypothetical protein